MSFDPVSYLMGSKNGDGTAQPPMTETTWADLKALRDGGNLVPGMQYRITDYETVITGSYDLSNIGAQGYLHNAGVPESHPFDVIVVADDESHLNENARAALHEGDTYFANSAIGAWKLKYCLDNDQQTYAWANANGKGVIFWMEDEFNNRVGYDFKNIRFLRYALKVADAQGDYTPPAYGKLAYDAETQPNRYGGMYQLFTALQVYMGAGTYVNPYLHKYKGTTDAVADYDFAVGANILGTIQFAEPDAQYLSAFGADWYYTFDYYDTGESAHVDASLNGLAKVPCRENYIELETEPLVAMMQGAYNVFGLGGSVWETNSVFTAGLSSDGRNNISGNRLGMHNWMNTFGDNCYSNTFGDNCSRNTFGYDCSSNTFGDYCYSNTFGTNDMNNALRGYIRYTELGDRCVYVTVNSLGAGSYFDGLEAGDFVQGLEVPAAQISQSGRYRLENYTNTGSAAISSGGSATLIHKTGYGQETAVSTTDGGATWA